MRWVRIRSPRLFWFGLPLLLLVFAANHVEYHLRRQRIRENARTEQSLVVKVETGPAGHATIGIDEQSMAFAPGTESLTFATLGAWAFDPKNPPACPQSVLAYNGKRTSCAGFMYPLQSGELVSVFCLLRATQTCCFGPRPQFNQYVFVETEKPVRFERLAPVVAAGRFVVDPKPSEGYIYRMEGAVVHFAADRETETDPVQYAKQHRLPLFDWAKLEPLAARPVFERTVPEWLRGMDGRTVVVAGYLLNRADGPAPQILVGQFPPPGTPGGARPTIFSALAVCPSSRDQLPPLWRPKGAFIGMLHVSGRPEDWGQQGIACVRDARCCDGTGSPPGVMLDPGPALPVPEESILLAALLLLTLRSHPRTAVPARNGNPEAGLTL